MARSSPSSRAALAQLWGAQQWAPLAVPGATTQHPLNPSARIPDLSGAFTQAERKLVADAVLVKCDALDGAKDGLVQATQACQSAFNLKTDVATCTGERNGQCLSAAQKTVIASVFAGGRTTDGQAIYSAFPVDPGLAGDNWGLWKFTNSVALDPLSVGTVFSVPPGMFDPLKVDISARLPMFSATNEVYRESGLSLMTPPGHENPVNLAKLKDRGAKMIVYHGVADAIFSAEDTRQWMLRLDRAMGGQADSFARFFPVPGMAHCSGGLATDQFDLLSPLVKWVEQGQAPQAVVATARGAGTLERRDWCRRRAHRGQPAGQTGGHSQRGCSRTCDSYAGESHGSTAAPPQACMEAVHACQPGTSTARCWGQGAAAANSSREATSRGSSMASSTSCGSDVCGDDQNRRLLFVKGVWHFVYRSWHATT